MTGGPGAQGIDARGVLDLIDGLEADPGIDPHSLAINRGGRTLAAGWWAPYSPDRLHLMYSCSKTFTATAVATLVDDGVIALDDSIVDHLPAQPEWLVRPWRSVQVRHCLSMTVGHTQDAWTPEYFLAGDPLASILANPPDARPGSVFCYNQVATYLLSRMVHHRTGHGLLAHLRQRILDPLGAGEVLWYRDVAGYELGFTGAHVRTADLLALAQLWLDRGAHPVGRLIADSWFDQATSPFLPVPADPRADDWSRGYGFSVWLSRNGYRGDGAFGQFALVLPAHDAVVALTGETSSMQGVLDLVWETLIPALEAGDRDGTARKLLAERLKHLAVPMPDGRPDPALGTLTFTRSADSDLDPSYSKVSISGDRLVLHRAGVEHPVTVGHRAWAESTLSAEGHVLPVVCAGGWVDRNRFEAEVRIIETPHRFTVTADRGEGRVSLRWIAMPLVDADPMLLAVRPTPE